MALSFLPGSLYLLSTSAHTYQRHLVALVCLPVCLPLLIQKEAHPKLKAHSLPHSTVPGTKQFFINGMKEGRLSEANHTWLPCWSARMWPTAEITTKLILIVCFHFFFFSEKPINCISGWMETSRPSNCSLCSLRSSPLLQTYCDKYVSA